MNILEEAESFAKTLYPKNDKKHQWHHIETVRKRALELASQLEDVDTELLLLAVIFHDVDYHSQPTHEENYRNHVESSVKIAEKFLREHDYPEDRIVKIKEIMLDHSNPHREKRGDSKFIEGKILYDSDKSTALTTLEMYEKYYPRLYLEETRKLVQKPTKTTSDNS